MSVSRGLGECCDGGDDDVAALLGGQCAGEVLVLGGLCCPQYGGVDDKSEQDLAGVGVSDGPGVLGGGDGDGDDFGGVGVDDGLYVDPGAALQPVPRGQADDVGFRS